MRWPQRSPLSPSAASTSWLLARQVSVITFVSWRQHLHPLPLTCTLFPFPNSHLLVCYLFYTLHTYHGSSLSLFSHYALRPYPSLLICSSFPSALSPPLSISPPPPTLASLPSCLFSLECLTDTVHSSRLHETVMGLLKGSVIMFFCSIQCKTLYQYSFPSHQSFSLPASFSLPLLQQ